MFINWCFSTIYLLSLIESTSATDSSVPYKDEFIDLSIKEAKTVLTKDDFDRIDEYNRVKKSKPLSPNIDNEKEMHNSNLFEGDIILIRPQSNNKILKSDAISALKLNAPQKNGVKNGNLKWPGNQVPYTISTQFTPTSRTAIAAAMQEFEKHTCIRFVPRTNQRDFINIQAGNGCNSFVGRMGGEQTVNLGAGCVHHGIIMHELMHAYGFYHEQSRPDRDAYVIINYKNILAGNENQFQKAQPNDVETYGQSYDYLSVLHYGEYTFSNGAGKTIEARQPGIVLSQTQKFSQIDINKLNAHGRCSPNQPKPEVPNRDPSINPSSCRDFSTYECSILKQRGYCQVTHYASVMTQQCPVTCLLCKG